MHNARQKAEFQQDFTLDSPACESPSFEYNTSSSDNVVIFSNNNSSRSSIDPIGDDLILNEFIQNLTPNQMPILERRPEFQQYFEHSGDNLNNWGQNDQAIDMRHYYLVEFLSCLFVAIVTNSSILILNIMQTPYENSLSYYVLSKLLLFFSVGYVVYIFSTPDTYRSINTSIDFLAVNCILYAYPLTTVLLYFSIQFLTSFLGAMISIGLHYSILIPLDNQKLLDSIITSNDSFLLTPSYIFLSIFIHIVIVIGLTFIMDGTNSLNCKQKVIHRVTYVGMLSLLYTITVGAIGFMAIYRLGLYLSISLIFGHPCDITIVFTYLAHTLIKVLVYPFMAFHIKYVWKNAIQRYIEYK